MAKASILASLLVVVTLLTPATAAIEALQLSLSEGCGADGEYWMLGNTYSDTPIWRRTVPQDNGVFGFYMFYGQDCWGNQPGLWGAPDQGLREPTGGCGDSGSDSDITCHLANACASRLRCSGTNLFDNVWVIAAASADSQKTCRTLALIASSDRSTPPLDNDWSLLCPAANLDYPEKYLPLSVVITTTQTTTSTSSTVTATETVTGTSTTVTQTTTYPVGVMLEASPRAAQLCNRMIFSSYITSNPYGQPVNFSWHFGPATSPVVQEHLLPSFSSVTTFGGDLPISTLRLNASDVAAAFAAIRAQGYSRLTIELAVNAVTSIGQSSWAYDRIEVSATEPSLEMESDGPTVVRVTANEPVRLAVKTREVAPSCSAARQVNVTWEYWARETSGWVALDGAPTGIVDVSRQPSVLDFAPLTFPPLSQHMFRARASFAGYPESQQAQTQLFRVMVRARPPPIAVVLGPRQASMHCGFALDASGSLDPSLLEGETGELLFRWSCAPDVGSHGHMCEDLVRNFNVSNASRVDGQGASGPVLDVEGGQLPVGAFLFTVAVRRAADGREAGAVGTASWSVRVANSTMPSITVRASWEDMARLPAVGITSEVSAHFRGGEACQGHASLAWLWSLVELGAAPDMEPRLVSLLTTENHTDGFLVRQLTSDLRHDLWETGEIYSYALLQAETYEQLTSLALRKRVSLAVLEEEGVSALAYAPPFVADMAPDSGSVLLVPPSGEVVRTDFAFSTSGWADEEPSSLAFAFYRFPGVSSAVLPVEWHNASSPRYWASLGGELLQTWGPTSQVSGVLLPIGTHSVVARAIDSLGSEGSAAVSDLTVLEPQGSLSMEEIEDALRAAEASRSPIRLLDACAVVAGAIAADQVGQPSRRLSEDRTSRRLSEANASAPGLPDASRRALADRILGILQTAVGIMDGSGDLMQKIGNSVVNLLAAGDSTLDMGFLSDVIALLDESLGLVVSASSGGTSTGSGNAVMGSIASLDIHVFEASKRSNQSNQSDQWGQWGPSARRLQGLLENPPNGTNGTNLTNASNQTLMSLGANVSVPELLRQLLAVTSLLGLSAQQALAAGEAQRLWAPGPGGTPWLSGGVAAADLENSEAGTVEMMPGLTLPPVRLVRIAMGLAPGDCGTLGVQQTEWLGSNPLRWELAEPSAVAHGQVKVVEVRLCGGPPVRLNRTGSLSSSLWVTLQLPPAPAERSGSTLTPRCLVYDAEVRNWTQVGMDLASYDKAAGKARCLAAPMTGAYAVTWEHVKDPVRRSYTRVFTAGEDKSNTVLIVLLVVVLSCACCCSGGGYGYWDRQQRLSRARIAAMKYVEEDTTPVESLAPIESDTDSYATPPPLVDLSNVDFAHYSPEELFRLARTTPSPPPNLVAAVDAVVLKRKKERQLRTSAQSTARYTQAVPPPLPPLPQRLSRPL